MNAVVELNAEDLACAAQVGCLQIARMVALGRRSDHGALVLSGRSLLRRLTDTMGGNLAEIALSRYLNLAWTPGGRIVTRGDVAGKIECRYSEHLGAHLLIYESDPDDKIFYLVVGEYPSLRVVGGLRAIDGKKEEFWRAPPETETAAWWVPQRALQKMDDGAER